MPVSGSQLARAAFAASICLLFGCDRYPADLRGSLEKARKRSLQVGFLERKPWAYSSEGTVRGFEAAIVRDLARSQKLKINWVHGPPEDLFRSLEHAEIHLVIGGLTESTPWAKHAALSEVFAKCRVVVGLPDKTAGTISDIEGIQVRVRHGSGLAAAIRKKGGIPVSVSKLKGAASPAAAPEYEIRALGLVPMTKPLATNKHVIALPRGENALYAALTRALPKSKECPSKAPDETRSAD